MLTRFFNPLRGSGNQLLRIKGLPEVLECLKVKSTIVIGSQLYLDNEYALIGVDVVCIDYWEQEYSKNKHILLMKNVEHRFDGVLCSADLIIATSRYEEIINTELYQAIVIKG